MIAANAEKYHKRWLMEYRPQKSSVIFTILVLISICGLGYGIFVMLSMSASIASNTSPLATNGVQFSVNNSNTPVKAALVALVREADLYALRATMRTVEDRFNKRHGYPWIILSDQPFTDHFQEWVRSMTFSPIYFGQAPAEEWHEPNWIDMKRAEIEAMKMYADGLYHGESLSWRKMTRYNAAHIAHHPLLKNFEYYWKVQAGSSYLCDIHDDPFLMMKRKGKKLGRQKKRKQLGPHNLAAFAITMHENSLAILSLWQHIKSFISENQQLVLPPEETIYPWIVSLNEYNHCHIWNNFMIISLDFLRSKEYSKLLQHLDRAGGFFYERWADGPVQTIAAALFLKRQQIYFMADMGYSYTVATNCPTDKHTHAHLQCICAPKNSFRTS